MNIPLGEQITLDPLSRASELLKSELELEEV